MRTENVHRTRSYSHPIRGGIYACFFAMVAALPRMEIREAL
jgi:hypothetical protein